MPAIRRPARGVSMDLVLAMTLGMVLVASPASAHERREVGPYTFVVGFGNEPAFAGQPNGGEVTISETESEDPVVEGVELEVEVTFGDDSTTLAVEPNFVVGVFGQPGNYGADFFPSRPGQYSFRFFGTVGDQEVDETFTSGPETFSDANDPAEFAFPEADPPVYEVAGRVEAESARVAEAEEQASSANTMALAALIVGIVALLGAGAVGAIALRRRP
jgi:hypothetical protein